MAVGLRIMTPLTLDCLKPFKSAPAPLSPRARETPLNASNAPKGPKSSERACQATRLEQNWQAPCWFAGQNTLSSGPSGGVVEKRTARYTGRTCTPNAFRPRHPARRATVASRASRMAPTARKSKAVAGGLLTVLRKGSQTGCGAQRPLDQGRTRLPPALRHHLQIFFQGGDLQELK